MAYFVRLKHNSFWVIEDADSKEELNAKAKLLLAGLIISGMAAIEVVERYLTKEKDWLEPKLYKPDEKDEDEDIPF